MNLNNYTNEIKTLFYASLVYLNIDIEIGKILVILIFIDMFAGAIKSIFLQNLTFSIQKFWAGFIKKAMLLLIVFVLALTARALGFDDFKIMVSTVIKIMILNEAISIFNSARSIYDGKLHKSSDFISKLIETIGNYLANYLNKLFKIIENEEKTNL